MTTCYNWGMKKAYDLIIIGSGPAGTTAALYAKRANLDVAIIEQGPIGGKLVNIDKIDNYPGISSISGIGLSNKFLEQIKAYNVEILNARVVNIKDKVISLANSNTLEAKAILIATGSSPQKLDLPNASQFESKGISYCATCDGFFFRKKDVIVIGDSHEALQESLYLSNLVNKLTILSTHKVLEDELKNQIELTSNIEVIYNHKPINLIIDNDKLSGLQIIDLDTNKISDINCAGIFPYIKFNPATSFVSETILDERGFIKVNESMATSIDGIYAAGDCVSKSLRQVVTACSDGAIAATSIIKYLKKPR